MSSSATVAVRGVSYLTMPSQLLGLCGDYSSSATEERYGNLSAVNVPAKTLQATFWIIGGDSIHYTVRRVLFSRTELLLHNREVPASNLKQEIQRQAITPATDM
jgi:hypothetical protein